MKELKKNKRKIGTNQGFHNFESNLSSFSLSPSMARVNSVLSYDFGMAISTR